FVPFVQQDRAFLLIGSERLSLIWDSRWASSRVASRSTLRCNLSALVFLCHAYSLTQNLLPMRGGVIQGPKNWCKRGSFDGLLLWRPAFSDGLIHTWLLAGCPVLAFQRIEMPPGRRPAYACYGAL